MIGLGTLGILDQLSKRRSGRLSQSAELHLYASNPLHKVRFCGSELFFKQELLHAFDHLGRLHHDLFRHGLELRARREI